jgi:hypothetical protein
MAMATGAKVDIFQPERTAAEETGMKSGNLIEIPAMMA